MLKYLFPNIDWDYVKAVGFDLDGTLYDELDFIIQVYKPISLVLSDICKSPGEETYFWMVKRWLEKGSSYNLIFDEVLSLNNIEGGIKKRTIAECIDIYRSYKPELVLSTRVKIILEYITSKYEVFLITDGSSALQRAKIESLSLYKFFNTENIGISGDYGSEYQKPSILINDKIKIVKSIDCKNVVYFGDRYCDREFAKNSGFKYIHVKCLHNVECD